MDSPFRCTLQHPPHSSRIPIMKLRAELQELQAAVPPPKNCTNTTSKPFSHEKSPTFVPPAGPPRREEVLSDLHPLCLRQPGLARLRLLPARDAACRRALAAAGAGCPLTASFCPPLTAGTGTGEQSPQGGGPTALPALCWGPGWAGSEVREARSHGGATVPQ